MQRVLITAIVMVGLYMTALELSRGGGIQAAPAVQQDPEPEPFSGFSVAGGSTDSNGDMIAVTGVDLTGTSILYLIDTRLKQLAVYQAQGGSKNTRRIVLVGARRIDYDLELQGYNDESEYSWSALDKMFSKIGDAPARGGGADPKRREDAPKRGGGE
ncbi:MAG: hypothetical protein H6833_06295 [Planctomycetes bacterium]|nr:hypothetical protein [Planctomycetota bacterium]